MLQEPDVNVCDSPGDPVPGSAPPSGHASPVHTKPNKFSESPCTGHMSFHMYVHVCHMYIYVTCPCTCTYVHACHMSLHMYVRMYMHSHVHTHVCHMHMYVHVSSKHRCGHMLAL